MSIYEDITNQIVVQVEAGNIPWVKPWKENGKAHLDFPFNALSKKKYNGINVLILWAAGFQYSSNGWVTYKQAQKLGGSVKKGQKSTKIVFWNFKEFTDKDGETTTIPFARGYNVFNLDQCEGIEYETPEIKEIKDCKAVELANKNGVKLVAGGDTACYIPDVDVVRMPLQEQFKSEDDYNATLNHEMVHWSGNEKRLAREFGRRFGDEAYGMEELVAEIGSAFLCAHQGIQSKLQHAEYVASWMKTIKKDSKAIFTASSQAQKATEYLLKVEAKVEKQAA